MRDGFDNGRSGVLRFAPMGSVALLSLVALLPWGLPAADRFFLPLLPVIAIHYWVLRHDALIPEWLVFLTGLGHDVLTYGPLGYWALMYLLAYAIALMSARMAARGNGARLALLLVALAAVATCAWAGASLYFLELADWRPYALGTVLAACAAIFILPLLRSLDRRDGGVQRPVVFARRG